MAIGPVLRGVLFCAPLVVLVAPSPASADVVVRINGDSCTACTVAPLNQTVTIPLGVVDGELTVHVFDNAGPTADVGRIVLSGQISGSGRVNLLVAGMNDPFPDDESTLLSGGIRDLGVPLQPNAIEFTSDTPASALALRNATRVAIAITGDLKAPLTVGHVLRFQARGRVADAAYAGGNILAPITATEPDGAPVTQSEDGARDAIATIIAGNSIAATIQAGSVDDPDNPVVGSITRIVVGVDENPAPAGITGDILAEAGAINNIYTAGPIGYDAAGVEINPRPRIRAGRDIRQIRAVLDRGGMLSFRPLDKSFAADIHAGLLVGTAGVPHVDPYTAGQGWIEIVDTAGDFSGSIRAVNIIGQPGERRGIYVEGALNASITVDYVMNYANIVATRTNGSIRIGRQLKGAVIATGDPAAPGSEGEGVIDFITVGAAALDTPELVAAYGPYTAGLVGLNTPPQSISNPRDWFSELPLLTGRDNLGAYDGLVAASHRINALQIRAVTRDWIGGSLKSYVPRIESPLIEKLIIGELLEGSVWSGRMQYQLDALGQPVLDELGSAIPANVREDDYSDIRQNQIGCVGYTGEVWTVGNAGLNILHEIEFFQGPFSANVSGDLHVAQLPESRRVLIEGTLTEADGGCGCRPIDGGGGGGGGASAGGGIVPLGSPSGCDDSDIAPPEYSPREPYRNNPPDPLRGRIFIRDPEALSGGVVIGADGSGEWLGEVWVAGTLLAPDAQYTQLPRVLDGTSSPIGIGAAGVPPFTLHNEGSVPARLPEPGVPLDTAGFANGTQPIILTHYGQPARAPGVEPIDGLEFQRLQNGVWSSLSTPETQFSVAFADGSGLRGAEEVVISGAASGGLTGYYRVRLNPLTTVSVGSSSLLPNPAFLYDNDGAGGFDEWYYFYVPGCFYNETDINPADIVSIGGFPPPDNAITVDDYTSFINAYAGDDLLADIVSIGGFPPPDGELTVDDYTSFINAFTAGCE